MDIGTIMFIVFFALPPAIVLLSMIKVRRLQDNGEKLDATIHSYREVSRSQGDAHRRVYVINIGYNYMGTEYRRDITMSRSAMKRHFPELTGFNDLPVIELNGVISVFRQIGSALRNMNGERSVYAPEKMSRPDMSKMRLPIVVSRHDPRFAVADMVRLEALHAESR